MTNGNGNQSQDLDKISDLIRKCLALSESPNEYEATSAMAKAQELLEKYNLTLAQVKQDQTSLPELIDGEVDYEGKEWLRTLYSVVARHNFCQLIGHSGSSTVSIVGRYTNVCLTVEMADWLRQQMERLCLTETSGSLTPYSNLGNGKLNFSCRRPTDARSYRVGWLTGCVTRISQRLQELANQRRVETPSLTALTVNLMGEAENYLHQLYPSRVSHQRSQVNGLGYRAGQVAGDKVGLTPPSRHMDSGPLRLNGGS